MIRRHVRVDRDRRAPRQRRQLQLRELDDDAVVGRQLGQPLDERDPDVAAEDRRVRRARGEERGGQRRRRRLALRAGDADRRRRTEAQEQVRLADERGRGEIAGGPRGPERAERGPEAGLGRRVVGVDRRRGHDQRGMPPGRGRVHLGPQAERHVAALEGGDRRPELGRRTAVVDRDPGAGVGQEAGERRSRSGRSRGRSPAGRAGRRPGRRRGRARRGRSSSAPRAVRHQRVHCSRSIEARKRTTPSRPARIPTIQKRRVIFSSSQPGQLEVVVDRRHPEDPLARG